MKATDMALSRRRFLSLVSAACLVAPAAGAYRWQGSALGAHAQIILDHPDAEAIVERALAEVRRLEGIFSLYRSGSELARLNAAGWLSSPSFEMLDCLAIARRVYRLSAGRFDPTIQRLWQISAEAYAANRVPDRAVIEAARRGIGFDRVTFDSAGVKLGTGQALTLNGIAQGYIADRIAILMKTAGIADVLIDTGEIVALGAPGDKTAWPVTIAGESHARLLTNRALATSATFGTLLDDAGSVGHILDPRTGRTPPSGVRQVTVSAETAALADAVSTALCLSSSEEDARNVSNLFKTARLENIVVDYAE